MIYYLIIFLWRKAVFNDKFAERNSGGKACGAYRGRSPAVLSAEALDNLKLARGTLHGKLLGGIFPVVSHRNACFLNNEISGIRVCDEIVGLYEGLGRDEAEELAVTVSAAIAGKIAPYTDGLYLMTPFRRVALMERIIRSIRQSCPSQSTAPCFFRRHGA